MSKTMSQEKEKKHHGIKSVLNSFVMFGFTIIVWRSIDKYNEDKALSDSVLLRDKKGEAFEGWLDDDGWHCSKCADHLDFPVDPQPVEFAYMPKT